MLQRFLISFLVLGLTAPVASAQCPWVPELSSVSFDAPPHGVPVTNCPLGDGVRLASLDAGVAVHLVGADGGPCSGVPYNLFEVDGATAPLRFADIIFPDIPAHDVHPAGFTEEAPGRYFIRGTLFAGGQAEALMMQVEETPLFSEEFATPTVFRMNSPDITGDGWVNLADVDRFAQLYNGDVDKWEIDFAPQYGQVNLADVSFFAMHIGHRAPDNGEVDPVE